MGGAVSSGRDNNELIDNLMGSKYIRTRSVEQVFRSLDRADYMLPLERDKAYKDLAWRSGPLHMSAPCIYSEVMENLELKPGLSFLNVGSGTGYLSTLVGLIIGSGGISHGVEVHSMVMEYATTKLKEFLENSATVDEFDFCEPKYYLGNGLCLAALQCGYDRVYVGAGCPEEYTNYFKQLIRVGGILVMPLNDNLVQVRRVAEAEWVTTQLLNVSFLSLRVPTEAEKGEHLRLGETYGQPPYHDCRDSAVTDEQTPPRLQILARGIVRNAMRTALLSKNPHLRHPETVLQAPKKSCPRRICIPIEDESDVEGLNNLHDLDRASGANEMNALLSLVLSMGQNRVAGALRFDPIDSTTSDSSDDDEDDVDDADDADDNDDDAPAAPPAPVPADDAPERINNIDGINRVLHRAISAVEWPNCGQVDSTGRGRLSLTFEYNASQPGASQPSTSTERLEDDDVPSEVEIDLQKQVAEASSYTEEMEATEERGVAQSSSEEQSTSQGKRQKFDSGIGEENSPSSGSMVSKDCKTDSEQCGSSDRYTSDDNAEVAARRRLPKRSRCEVGTHSSSESESGSSQPSGHCRRHKRPSRPPPGRDARRLRLSIMMKRGVKELPLPYALKKYVNLHRCFEF